MSGPADKLTEYRARRDFSRTAEPRGEAAGDRQTGLVFSIQKHAATRLHYDLRLEWNGVLLSWAVTRGPSADPGQKRLAVRTEDHPFDYARFEGTIPKGEYGGGTVMLWDEGTWTPTVDVDAGLAAGSLKMVLAGARMRGGWALVRMKPRKGDKRENWLLIKERDAAASDAADGLTADHDTSVRTGRSMDEIARDAPAKSRPASGQGGRRPAFRKVQLATLVSDPPGGEDWLHETKFDGYRCLAALGKGGPRLYTRGGKDWTDRFASLEGAFDALDCASALIDGEIVAARVAGSAFSSLQEALADGGPLVFHAFDLLSLDGEDLADRPQTERRDRLSALLGACPPGGALQLSEQLRGRGPEIFAAACAAGAEGIVSKRADAPYRGRRTDAWRKTKCGRRREFVVGGLSPSDKRGRPFASLLVGEEDDDGLRYRGRVGTGFTERDLDDLADRLRPRKESPFFDVPADVARTARWLVPETVIEVEFAELTSSGQIRHGAFVGMREDKPAAEVKDERAASDPVTVAGIAISSPGRGVFGSGGPSKLDVAQYYERAGARLTEIAGHRPLSLLRCPKGIDGQCFFQKHGHATMPAALRRLAVEDGEGATTDHLYATRAASFVAAAQMGSVEFHIWGARTDRLDRPDRLVFDLDPGDGVEWTDVRRAATDLRDRLADIGLESGALLTGGKGIHVWVPLRRRQGWDAVRGFAKTVAHVLEVKEPERFVATMSKARRKGRIFVDWLRNERGATAIAPYSIRARPGAPVAVPVAWDELASVPSAAAFSLDAIDARLEAPCPYLAQSKCLQTLDHGTAERLQDWIDR